MAGVADVELTQTDGYVVESADGDLGWVEDVWLDERGEPCALAVRMHDGRHGLVLREEVLAVDRDYRWVVVRPHPHVLELRRPRLAGPRGTGERSLAARWETTGEELSAAPRRPLSRLPARAARRLTARLRLRRHLPPAYLIGIFIAALLAIVGATITLVMLVAKLVTGEAY
ncbi:MAG TPA: hypothetical protein VNJ46_05000 [Gaiellaceae bacterium]|nr:hypothetical protein [Gaiellaceae bacterium]